MITPEWLDMMLNMLRVHKELQESILRDMVRRIMKTDFTVTDTAAWQAEKLQQSGMLYDDIITEVSIRTKRTAAEVRKAFQAAETEVFNYDNEALESAGIDPKAFRNISPAMKDILFAAGLKTYTAAKNITKTTAVTTQTAFINACDVAHMQIASGAFSYNEAIRQAVKNAAVQGFTVRYPTGKTTSLDAAVRRAVLTGVNQTCGKLQEMRADEYEVDLMETTAHFGARPTHAEWQGQVVSRSGRSGYLSLDDIGYGAVDGFMGANCRHNWHMYFEGYSHRAYTPEQLESLKNETVTYEDREMPVWQARERQRAMERSVRRYKQELVAYDEAAKNTTEPEERIPWQAEFNDTVIKLKHKEAEIKDFCEQTGLQRETIREQVFAAATENGIKGFGKSVSGKAVQANKALDFIKNDAIIKAKSGLPKVIKVDDEKLYGTSNVDFPNIQSIVPKATVLKNVHVIAGYGTSVPLRDLKRLYYTYPSVGSVQRWQKKVGVVFGENFSYEIHWYSNGKFVSEKDIKTVRVKKK